MRGVLIMFVPTKLEFGVTKPAAPGPATGMVANKGRSLVDLDLGRLCCEGEGSIWAALRSKPS